MLDQPLKSSFGEPFFHILFSTSNLIKWTTRENCSYATFKWDTNGFTNPEGSFSVFPSPDMNKSHMRKRYKIKTKNRCQKTPQNNFGVF